MAASRALIRETAMENPNLDEVASRVGLSRSRFFEQFKTCVGASPQQYLDWARMAVATRLLATTQRSLAVISFATHDPADPAGFSRQFGLGGPSPKWILTLGGSTNNAPLDQLEVDVDLEVAHAVAPRAQLLNYEAPLAGNVLIGPALDAIVAQHRADVVSVSWGQGERSYRPGDEEPWARLINAAFSTETKPFDVTPASFASEYPTEHGESRDWILFAEHEAGGHLLIWPQTNYAPSGCTECLAPDFFSSRIDRRPMDRPRLAGQDVRV